ncbi:MAG: maleylpyruvate isomerase N-terminal domain-containing protein [Actinomycetota bacterium]
MSEYSAAYRGCRARVAETMIGLDDQGLSRRVPACPDWTVKDLAAHLVGTAADFKVGNLEQVGSNHWTSTQIAERGRRTIDEVTALAWTGDASVYTKLFSTYPPASISLSEG